MLAVGCWDLPRWVLLEWSTIKKSLPRGKAVVRTLATNWQVGGGSTCLHHSGKQWFTGQRVLEEGGRALRWSLSSCHDWAHPLCRIHSICPLFFWLISQMAACDIVPDARECRAQHR